MSTFLEIFQELCWGTPPNINPFIGAPGPPPIAIFETKNTQTSSANNPSPPTKWSPSAYFEPINSNCNWMTSLIAHRRRRDDVTAPQSRHPTRSFQSTARQNEASTSLPVVPKDDAYHATTSHELLPLGQPNDANPNLEWK